MLSRKTRLISTVSSSNDVVHIGEIGSHCDSDPTNPPCTAPNTFCINNICSCAPFYEPINGECILKSSLTLGSKCRTSAECTGKGEYCNRSNGKCRCLSNHLVLGGKCKPVIYPGQSGCEDSRQCSKAYPGTICTSQKKCQCPKGFRAKAFSCFRSKPYVMQRKRSEPFRGSAHDYSIFNDFKERNKFLIEVAAGADCPTGNEQCSGGSSCVFGKCECPFGTILKSGECVQMRKVYVGSPCNTTQICFGISICVSGVCQCPDGMIVQGGQCQNFTSVSPGASCATGEFCGGGSVCVNSICLCVNGTIMQNGICSAEQKKNFGEKCMNGEACSDNLFCIDGICQCQQGTFFDDGLCIPITGSLGKCSDSSQCTKGSYCDHQSGFCICSDGYHYQDQTCVSLFSRALISPIKSCVTSSDCLAGTKCIARKCHCPAGEIFMNGRCQMVFAEPGESCISGETCVSNHVCIKGKCLCPDGEVSRGGDCVTEGAETRNYTSSQAEPNTPCNRGELCTGGSFCSVVDGLCRCPANTVFENGICEFTEQSLITLPPLLIFNHSEDMPKKPSNRSMINITRVAVHINRCESNRDCKGGSYCSDYRCSCPADMAMKGGQCQRVFPASLKRVGRLHGRCTTSDDCTARNTACHNGVCVCLSGYRIFGGTECILRTVPFPVSQSQTTAKVNVMRKNVGASRKIAELTTNKAAYSGVGVGPKPTIFSALPLIDAGVERIPPSRQTEVIVNVSGGVCNETTLCLFFSICHNGVCECPLGTRISDTECKFIADASGTNSTLPISSQTTQLLSSASSSVYLTPFLKPLTTPFAWKANEVWPTVETAVEKIIASMNVQCKTSQQCPSGAQCIDGFCSCMSGTTMSRYGFCIPIVNESTPGMSCTDRQTCTGFSKCVNGKCVCPPERNNIIDNKCVKSFRETVPLGTYCTPGQFNQCTGGGTCVYRKCLCSFGNSQCTGNDQGGKNNDCTNDPTICRDGTYCLKGFCVCPFGHVCTSTQINAQQRNLPYKENYFPSQQALLVSAGAPCSGNEVQCTGNSICANGFCTCPSGERVISGLCTPINSQGTPGEVCEVDNTKCTGGSVCIDNYCRCLSNQVAINGRCTMQYYSVLPNHACGENLVCTGGSICTKGICRCPRGMSSATGVSVCRPVPLINAVFTEMNSEFCVIALDGQWLCTDGRICVNGSCVCPQGYAMSGSYCVPVISSVQISAPGGRCSSEEGLACISGAICVSEVCVCSADRVVADNKCVRFQRYAKTAESCDAQGIICSVRLVPVVYANVLGVRLAVGNASFQTVHLYVNLTILVEPGSNCVPSCPTCAQCNGGSVCLKGQCKCPVGQFAFNSQCHPIMSLKDKEIIPITPNKTSTSIRIVQPGGLCNWTTVCGAGSSCVIGKCVCLPGYIPSNERNNCTSMPTNPRTIQTSSNPGESCTVFTVCVGGSICLSGICACPPNSYLFNKVCTYRRSVPKKRLVLQLRTFSTAWPSVMLVWNGLRGAAEALQVHLSGLEIPGGLSARDVPQMILLTFDGPVTDLTFAVYKSLFSGKYRNPNGCPIKGTFFVSNEWNNYDQTQWLRITGHEVAVNSITRQNLGNQTIERWTKEMAGMRDALQHFSYASASDITGVRAPQLELGGDNQFDMMEKYGFLFDNTMSASGGPYWPQTLAYQTAWKCSSRYCPRKAHPSVWEIPINRFSILGSQNEFTMLKEAVQRDDSPMDVAKMLEMNFNRSYNYNRAPYLLTADNDFLTALPNEKVVIAIELFIEKVLKNSDVYFVTATQALKWIKRPTRLLHIHNFESWQCNMAHNSKVISCENPSHCSFTCNGKIQTLRICGICPQVYPNLGDPTGTGNSTANQ
uniref:EGF-like domain-containing protein n=1 Tax=Setaria digitata TaxID=48799 RepID=A0A915Q2C2_9BILA